MIKVAYNFVIDKRDRDENRRPICFSYFVSNIEKYYPNTFKLKYYKNEEIFNSDAEIILISTYSPYWSQALNIIKRLRKEKPEIKIIVGGQHITQLPHLLPKEADFGIVGEGEVVLPKILSLISNNEKDIEQYKKLDGIVINENGNIFIKPAKRLNFDEIAPPDLLADNGLQYELSLFTSRGCPYSCSFCASSKMWKVTTMQSAKQIADDIQYIANNFPQVDKISFSDDLFVLDRNRLRDLHNELSERGLLKRFRYNCAVRADLVDDELCELMRNLNIKDCYYGFESGNDRILKILKPQGKLSVAVNMVAAKKLHEEGFGVGLATVVGVYGETEQELRDTFENALALVEKGYVGYLIFNILTPLPNTKYWDIALEKGIVQESNEFDWGKLRYFADYIENDFDSFDEWMKVRKEIGATYLNEEVMPLEKFIKIFKYYDEKRASLNCYNPKKKPKKVPKYKKLFYLTLKPFSKKYRQKYRELCNQG